MFTSPHHLREVAADLPVVMLPLILYTDDTSGHKSKQWNKFDSWCIKIAGLPNHENTSLENIYHLCSSNKVKLDLASEPNVYQYFITKTGRLH